MPKEPKRSYVKKARQEKMEQTRARIVDAVVALHQEVGPSKTTIAAIAERAGVQRLTVYRHFPEESDLIAACSHRYSQLNPPPDPARWPSDGSPTDYAKIALEEIYDYYHCTAPMLTRVYRDAPEDPALMEVMSHFDAYFRQIADDLAARLAPNAEKPLAQLAARHLVKFPTWQSLEEEKADTTAKVQLAMNWLAAASA